MGYILWIFGFTGSERFYYGKPISGTIYFFTLGLLGIGWFLVCRSTGPEGQAVTERQNDCITSKVW
jgi:TM2 domain-containing membrane protein YozV